MKGCFQILEGQHINQEREREKGQKRKSWPRQTKAPFEAHSANKRDVVV